MFYNRNNQLFHEYLLVIKASAVVGRLNRLCACVLCVDWGDVRVLVYASTFRRQDNMKLHL